MVKRKNWPSNPSANHKDASSKQYAQDDLLVATLNLTMLHIYYGKLLYT